MKRIIIKRALILLFYIICLLLVFYYDFFKTPQQEQFVDLASAFVHGKFYFQSATFDSAVYNGHYYWPLGPFPAILLMPFVLISSNLMRQGYMAFFINLINAFLLFRITRKISGNLTSSFVISFAVLFSTAYLGLALIPWSWYHAQTIGFCLILLALEAYFFNRSWFIVGIYISLAYATRISLILVTVFFILDLFYSDQSKKIKLRKLVLLVTPIIVSVILIGFYNYNRFGSLTETGYSYQPMDRVTGNNRSVGLWSSVHIPGNLFTMFLRMPYPVYLSGTHVTSFPYLRADGFGLSILLTSPIFIWILFSDWKVLNVKSAAITALIMILAVVGSFTGGGFQYGYRYAIDAYPMLFILLIYSFKKEVSIKFLCVAIAGFIMNLYFINTIFFPK